MIVEHAWILSKTEKAQLIKKLQLVHFLTVNNKSLNLYQELVCFEKEVYKVNVRTVYLNKTAVQEILLFLSKSMITEKYGTLCDQDKVKCRFDVLTLEQSDDAGAKGLKALIM